MYKLLIVEDEKWEREGLVDFLDWPELNIEIVGTAANGVQGMKLAREHMPDIIITDIRMPKMDGIEFTRRIRQTIPGCMVIIITGYDDFEYAREAIQLGVCEFLLKPVEKDQLLRVLDKTVQNLSREREQAEHMRTMKRRLSKSFYEERERFLIDLIDSNPDELNAGYHEEWRNMSAFDNGIAAVIIKFDNYFFFRGRESAERQSSLRELFRKICMAVGGEGIAAQRISSMNEIILCLPAEGGRKRIYDVIRRIEQAFQGSERPETVIGAGANAKTLREFPESYQQARAALDDAFFMNHSKIHFYEDITQGEDIGYQRDYSFFTSISGYSKKVLRGVVSADTEKITAISEELFGFIKANACDKSLICNFFAGMISELSALLLNSEVLFEFPGMDCGNLLETLNGFIRLEDMKKWFLELLLYTGRIISEKKNRKEEYIVEKVMDIIKKEYKDSIGIETIAARLEISPNYLGGLFSQHVGKHFTDVLLDFRMKKAEELLASGLANVNDTAREVGFINAAHFCTVFKKKHGISPMDYQKKSLQKRAKYE